MEGETEGELPANVRPIESAPSIRAGREQEQQQQKAEDEFREGVEQTKQKTLRKMENVNDTVVQVLSDIVAGKRPPLTDFELRKLKRDLGKDPLEPEDKHADKPRDE